MDTTCLDEKYSTTRLLTQERPEIINNPEDKFETLLFLPDGENRKGEGGLRTKGYFKKSYEDKPLISIVTVVYNGEQFLEETIQSVINQTYDNVEYIIIDGGSTDGTLNIIKKYEERIDYWVSERDKGISDAFNKGISCSLGKLIGILNADDYYNQETINIISKEYFSADIFYGNLVKLDGKKEYLLKSSKNSLRSIDKCSMEYIYHPTFFVKKEIYKKYGLFNEDFKLAMDYEFFSGLNFNKVHSIYIDKTLTCMRMFGISDIYNYKAKLEVISAYKKRKKIFLDFNILNSYYFMMRSYVRFILSRSDIGRKIIALRKR